LWRVAVLALQFEVRWSFLAVLLAFLLLLLQQAVEMVPYPFLLLDLPQSFLVATVQFLAL
jgi:hypothetical protein